MINNIKITSIYQSKIFCKKFYVSNSIKIDKIKIKNYSDIWKKFSKIIPYFKSLIIILIFFQ